MCIDYRACKLTIHKTGKTHKRRHVYIKSTDPVKVLNNRHLSVVIIGVIHDVVLFHVNADVFFQLFVLVLSELESALQETNPIRPTFKGGICRMLRNFAYTFVTSFPTDLPS